MDMMRKMGSSCQLFCVGLCFIIVEDIVYEILDLGTAVAAPVDLPEVTDVVDVVELAILRR